MGGGDHGRVPARFARRGPGDERGDSYKSTEIQREAIAQWAQLNQVQIGKIEKDEDVSGAKAVHDRKLEKLVRGAENGVSDGVLVYGQC